MVEEIKHYIFVKNGRRHYAPQYLSSRETAIQWIFPVPESNAVGTLDDDSNGIVFVKFGDYGKLPECTIAAKDYVDSVYDLYYYRFCSNYAEDTIAYTQNRVVVIADVKKSEAFYANCGLSMDDYLIGIHFLDPQDKLFVLSKAIKGDKPYKDTYLRIAKLKGQELVDTDWSMDIGETYYVSPDFPLYESWRVHNRYLFVYEQKWHKIACTDGTKSLSHPFSESFNANTNRIGKVKDFAIHPKLPFGVIIEESAPNTLNLITLRWDITDLKKTGRQVTSFDLVLEPLKSLFGLDHLTLAYPSFSPDGNWYVVGLIDHGDLDTPESTHFIAIPVTLLDKKHPYFLDIDNLVVLGQVVGLTSIAWTSNPTSYVVSNGELLHKWDLDELPNARVFEVPEDDEAEKKKKSVFGRIAGFFGAGK
jgi:hypothetical protein